MIIQCFVHFVESELSNLHLDDPSIHVNVVIRRPVIINATPIYPTSQTITSFEVLVSEACHLPTFEIDHDEDIQTSYGLQLVKQVSQDPDFPFYIQKPKKVRWVKSIGNNHIFLLDVTERQQYKTFHPNKERYGWRPYFSWTGLPVQSIPLLDALNHKKIIDMSELLAL